MLYNSERPYTFDQMAGQKMAVECIRKQAILEQFMNVYIFHGQYGSGKTTMARILALAANCPKDERGNPDYACQTAKDILDGNCSDFMEIDGASKAGVEEVRKLIEDTAYKPYSLKKKIYVIDEAHMLSKAAFNALLKTLEEPPEYAIFILCTTDFKAIPSTIKSRAACYCFTKISNEDMTDKLMEICGRRGIKASKEACVLISKNADGSLRNAESLLEQASISNHNQVTEEAVSAMLGISDPSVLFSLLKDIIHGNVKDAAKTANRLLAEGKNLTYMIEEMIEIVSDAIILAYGGEPDLLRCASHYKELQKDFVSQGTPGVFIRLSKDLLKLSKEIRSGLGETALIVNVIQMADSVNEGESAVYRLKAEVETLKMQMESISMEKTILPKEEKSMREKEDGTETTGQSKRHVPQEINLKNGHDISVEQISVEIPFEEQCGANKDSSLFQDFQAFQSFFERDEQEEKEKEAEELPKEDVLPVSEETQAVFDRIGQVAEDDAAFFAAVYEGAKAEVINGNVTYYTPLKPIETLLKKYFEVFSIPAKVMFNKAVSI